MVNDDRVVNPDGGETVQIAVENRKKPEVEGPSSSKTGKEKELAMEEEEEANEEVPLIGNAECRICQDEDSLNNLESPCACSGSLKVNFLFSLPLSLLLANLDILLLSRKNIQIHSYPCTPYILVVFLKLPFPNCSFSCLP